jgi:ribonuclease Z
MSRKGNPAPDGGHRPGPGKYRVTAVATAGAIVLGAAFVVCLLAYKPLVLSMATEAFVRQQAPAARHFPDGLNVVLIGTGSPLADMERIGACIAVVAGPHTFVVDAGEGAGRNLALANIGPGKPDAVLLTHYHSDHIASLGEIMLGHWSRNASIEPLQVIGPPGVETVVRGFNAAYSLDDAYRIAHHGAKTMPPSGAGGVARTVELGPESDASAVVFDKDGLRITMFRVDHGPVKPAVGYRFDYGGRSVAFSGDTTYAPSIARNAAAVDILFNEALSAPMVALMSRYAADESTAKIAHDIPGYHSTVEQAARMASEAHAGSLVLYHIIPPLRTRALRPVFLGDAGRYYRRQITIGEDGMMFTLPPQSKTVRQGRRFARKRGLV